MNFVESVLNNPLSFMVTYNTTAKLVLLACMRKFSNEYNK